MKLKKLNSALDSDTDLTLRSRILRLEYTMQGRIFRLEYKMQVKFLGKSTQCRVQYLKETQCRVQFSG